MERYGERRSGMKLAFTLFEYFPFGGLQRDFLHIVRRAVARGHDASVFTRSWEGDVPGGIELRLVPSSAWTNVGRDEAFIRRVQEQITGFDGAVGFNKMPGLDVYYAADPCHAHRAAQRGVIHRATRRQRRRSEWERSVFGVDSRTHVLLIAHGEKERFQQHYGTPDERFHLLPPNLTSDTIANDPGAREALRRELDVGEDQPLLLCVGSGFRTKGLDRSIRALASLENERARLIVVGRGKDAPYTRLARELGVESRVTFLGARTDVARFYATADLLLHPARSENTGTVLLEAMVNGLPVIASAECGFASHVRAAEAGVVLASPFEQDELGREVAAALSDDESRRARAIRGKSYGEREELYSGHECAVRAIETILGTA